MNQSKRNKKFLILAVATLLLVVTAASVTFAWLAGSGSVPSSLVRGSVLTQYFHCGTGTEDDPFVITRPVHYYNLIYLYQRKEGFSDQGYYFQLGYDFDNNGTPEFYTYDKDGVIQDGSYSSVLNMESYKGDNALLPIGTSEKPFIGTFDGNGLTVKNLHIRSTQEINGDVYTTCDVGIFGYVSGVEDSTTGVEHNGTVKNVFFDNVTIDLTGADPDAICHGNASVHDTDPNQEGQEMVYVGYLAGHIKITSMMDQVYVNNCKVLGGTLSNSEFGYFGVLEDADGHKVTALGERVATLRDSGNDAGFGGSLDMNKMFNRIKTVLSSGSTNRVRNYPTAESIVEPSEPGFAPTVEITATSTGNNLSSDYGTIYRYQTPTAGSYIGSYNTNGFNYLYGLKDTQTTEATVYTQTGEEVDAWLISHGGHYLCTTGTAINHGVTSEANAKKWLKDANNRWYTYINNKIYYLNQVNSLSIQLADVQAQNATVWTQGTGDDAGTFYTTIGGRKYYLFYTGSTWALTPNKVSYQITDGKGNYLTGTTTGVANTATAADSIQWQVQHSDNDYTIYAILNGTNYYLSFNNGLTMTTTNTVWHRDGNGLYTTVDGERLNLLYDGGWKAQLITGYKISSGSHYLTASNTTVSDTTKAGSVNWKFSSDSGDTQIYTVIGTAKRYLAYDGSYGVTVSATPVTWHRDGTNCFYYTHTDGKNYYLQYADAWAALPLEYRTIGDGNGNYLVATGGNIFDNTANAAAATHFFFSTPDADGAVTIQYIRNDTIYSLGINNGNFGNTATKWKTDGNRLYNGTYYLVYQNGNWEIQNRAYQYLITDGTHYLNANGTNLAIGTDAETATKWTFSNTTNLDNPSGTVSVSIGNSTYYLSVNQSGMGCRLDPYVYALQFNTTPTDQQWTLSNKQLRNNSYNTYYLDISSTAKITENSGTTLSSPLPRSQNLNGTTVSSTAQTAAKPVLTLEDITMDTPPAIAINGPDTTNLAVTFETTKETLYAGKTSTVRRSTYIPLRVNSDDENYSGTDTYGVSPKNTGYIIGGTYSAASGSGQGDIRVSQYDISNIDGSYNSGTFTTLYTFAGTGSPIEITDENKDNFVQLDTVKEKCKKILTASGSNVYGLHFMNTAISTSHIIQAEYATVMGNTYINYDLPESCIDFNLVEPGYVTFMAGDYYSYNNNYNNAFFSLHQIFRNDDDAHTIKEIKEISKVYKKKNDEFANYLYQYKDGSWSGTYVAANYELKFDTAWITNPTNGNGTLSGKKIYYFEIPCNIGEYALGSVDGKTGAYLLYLDIGINGGAIMESIVSSEGNSDTDSLNVEFRSVGDPDITSPNYLAHSILQFSYNAPEVSDPDDFSVEVVFDENNIGDSSVSCPKGCYTIRVVNNSGSEVRLQVLLCDYRAKTTDPFEYGYQILYQNGDHATATFLPRTVGTSSYNYWKAAAGFLIPASGKGTEMAYQSSSSGS